MANAIENQIYQKNNVIILCEICYYRTRGGRLFSVLQIMENKFDLVGFRLGWQMVWLVLGWFLGTLTF